MKRGGSKIVLACETRWCSYCDSFKCALKNLDIMRTVVQEKQIKFNHESDALLQSSEFEIILQDYILIFDPVCELVNKCQRSSSNIADAIEYWLTLNIPTCNDNQDKLAYKKQQNLFVLQLTSCIQCIKAKDCHMINVNGQFILLKNI